MKKYLSVFLVIAIVLTLTGVPAVMAADTTVVHSIPSDSSATISVKEYTSHSGSGSTSPMYKGESLTYSLDFASSGEYRISLVNKCFYDTTEIEIVINSWTVAKKLLPRSDSVSQKVELGTLHVGKGKTNITLKTNYSACYISSLVLERIGDRTEYYISGSKPDNVGSGVTENKPSVGMSPASYGEFKFTAEVDGYYLIYAQVASTEGTNANVEAYIDNVLVGNRAFVGKGWSSFATFFVGTAIADKGEHTLKIRAVDSAIRFITGKIISVSGQKADDFLSTVREAKSAARLESILYEYSDELITPYADYLDKVFYKRIITDKLIDAEFSTLDEFDSLFVSIANDEINAPLITLTQNEKNTVAVEPGSFTVTIAPAFTESLLAIAALYTDDGMTLDSCEEVYITPGEEAELTNLEAKEGKTLLKIFFIKDLESLRPVELPLIRKSIYVSPDGNDNADGSESAPLKTISAALKLVKQSNDVFARNTNIYLAPGEHYVDSTLTIDDTFGLNEDAGIHFMSLNPDEPATISGGCDVTGWTDSDNDGIYEATVPDGITDVRQFYVNDMPAMRAKCESYFVADGRWDDESNNSTNSAGKPLYAEDGFYTYNPSFPQLVKPEDAEISYLILWTVQRLPVEDIVYDGDAGKTLIKMEQPYYSTALTAICDGGIQPTIGQKFSIENDLSLLDREGEFYFDKDTKKIYYKPFPEENLSKARTVVAKTELLFNISGASPESKVKNISFDNIRFRYGGYYTKVNREGVVTFQAENLVNAEKGHYQNAVSTGVGRTLETNILVENADRISFENCDFSCMGATALRYGTATTNSSVKGSIFTDIGGSALSIATWEGGKPIAENINIENNVISRIGIDFMSCPGISIYYAKNVDVLHNTIAHTPYSAISVNWGWVGPGTDSNPSTPQRLGAGGHNISYNRIYDISRTVVDGGHVYNLGYMSVCNVTHNYLTDSPDHGGVYLDTGASNVKINNNVFERCDKYNIAYGGSQSVVGNVATNNWADKEQAKDWPGEGCIFETVVGITDGNWPDEAKKVMANSGVTEEYKGNLALVDAPTWRTLDHQAFPREEGKIPGTMYINCDTYTDFYIKPQELETKPKPAIYTFSGTPGVADFRQREWLEYTINIEEAGDYYLSLYYNKGTDGLIDIFLTTSPIPEKYDNMYPSPGYGCPKPLFGNYKLKSLGTETTAHVPHIFTDSSGNKQPITLDKGTYYLRIHERSGGTNWSRFALTPVK